MAIFTPGVMYREPPPLFPTPCLELSTFFRSTPFFELTFLFVDPSLRKDGYFYVREMDRVLSATPLNPIIRVDDILQVDSIIRVHFIMGVPLTE